MERQAATTTITESRSMVIARRMWKRESGKKGIKCTLWLLKSAVLWKFNVFSPFLFPWSCVMNNTTIYIHTLCLGRKEEGEASKLFLCSHFLISLFRRWSGRGKLSKYQAVQQQQRPTNLFHSFFFLFCCSLPLRVCFVCSTTGCCCWFSLGNEQKWRKTIWKCKINIQDRHNKCPIHIRHWQPSSPSRHSNNCC